MLSNPGFQDWLSVQNCIRTQHGDEPIRRAVFRLMKRWGLSPLEKNSGSGIFLLAGQWIQPPDTIDNSGPRLGNGLHATIWRLLSGRGMERFMFTIDESERALETVAVVVVEFLKPRRPQPLRTNHKPLADMLAKVLPRWKIHSI